MKNVWVYVLLIGSAVSWGANFNVGKMAVDIMPPMSVIAWRFLLAGLVMMLILYLKERPEWRQTRHNLWIYFILGVIGIFGFNSFVFVGLKYTSAVNGSLVMATNPIVTIILAGLILRERISGMQVGGMVLSFLGVVFVLTGGSFEKLGSVSMGDLLVMAGNICWALYGVLGRRFVKGSSPLATSSFTMMIGALCLLPFIRFQMEGVSNHSAVQTVEAILFMAVFGSVLAYLWWNRGIAQIGVNRTSVFFNMVPVATLVIAACSGETVHGVQLFGTVLVIAGVILTTRKHRQKTTATLFTKSVSS